MAPAPTHAVVALAVVRRSDKEQATARSSTAPAPTHAAIALAAARAR
jgi:hypothetical protein